MTEREPDELASLIQRVSSSLLNLENRALAPHQITLAQWRILDTVASMEGGRVTDLVRALDHDQAAVSRIIGRLEKGEFVTREKHARDARAANVMITEQGRRVHEEGRKTLEPLLESVLLSFEETERDTLHTLLQKLLASTEKLEESIG